MTRHVNMCMAQILRQGVCVVLFSLESISMNIPHTVLAGGCIIYSSPHDSLDAIYSCLVLWVFSRKS